ncbi:MAG: amino acid adenylation domain-containing protein [Candidatus Aminicenantes bacterium]|nr:amino acid adenylation domain-containing protein [Candidatus Aminicenantes bacterium]
MYDKNYSGDVAIAASQSVKEREYWLKKLSGEPVKSSFPYDNKEPGYKESDKDHVDLRFSGESFSRLTWISNHSDARLLTMLAAGLIVLVNKYTGNRDVIVGMPIYKQEVEGDFINTVVALRCLLQEDMAFKDLLYQVKQTIDEAVKHQNYPIKTLLYDLRLPFSESDFPLFDIVLLLKNIQDPGYVNIPVNMEFVFFRTPEYLEVSVRYNRSLYDRETVERIAGHFSHLLQTAIFNVDISLAGIDILPGEEKKKLLEEFNRTWTGLQVHIAATIHRLFEDQVEKTPDRAAVVFVRQGQEPETLTYRQLNEKARGLARVLKEKGIGSECIVALLMESSVHMAAAVLAVLKAGGAYLPIDMEAPEERKEFILKDSGTRLVLTGAASDTALFPAVGDIEQLDISDEHLYTLSTQSRPGAYEIEMETGSTGDPAYIIYTSGSTGRPKGVIVEHRQAVNTLVCRKEEYCMTPGHTALQLFSYAFDGFITSFFTPIISGSRLVLLSKDTIQDISKIVDVIFAFKVTHFISVPVLFQALITGMTAEEAVSLQVVTLAGDKVHSRLPEMAAAKNKNIEVVNEYGVTEAAVMSTIYRRQERDRRIKIGHPICNTSIYITKGDGHQHLAPIGVFGEMSIAGAGVTRGYLNNPELTAEKFIDLHHSSFIIHHSKLYCTGDLARWLPDGNIEFDGRIDFQVKVRGFRIELGEIERHLLAHSDIKETIVTASENDEGDKNLCAYIVSTRQLSVSELRDYLAGRVPEYMVPAYFVFLEGLPLSPNGKVDRKQLPPPTMSMAAGEYTAPRNRMEGQLVEIWAEILGIDKDSISIDANFFELGGHSLKATILLNRIIKEFNVRIAMVEIFKSPDIQSIVKLIKGAIEDIFVSICPAEEKAYYPLSPGQRRLFILHQMDFNSLAYNVSMTSVLGGKLDADKLERSFRQLIARHESLRTSFTTIGEQPVQKIHLDADLDFKIEYFTGDSLDHFEIADIVNNFVRPFDLSQAPLLRVGLVTTGTQDHILTVDLHHIITDGVSQKILMEDFMNLYRERPLPPLRFQYKDYSEWQQGRIVKDLFQQQEEFWMQQLAGEIPKSDLPTDFPRPAVQSFAGNVMGFQIDREKTTALHAMASSQNATLFMVLFAAYNIFLAKISNQEDIVVGTPVAGRRHADLEQIIGVFINMLALRNAPKGESTFNAFLKSLTQRTIEAFDNQDYAFEDLVDKIVKDRDVTRNPLFDVMFVMQNMFDPTGTVGAHETGGLGLKPYSSQERKSAQFDLTLYAVQMGDTLNFIFEYGTSLFREETIARFIHYFNKVIASVIESPGKLISGIEIISEEEKARVLNDFNATEAQYPVDKTIPRLFEEQVEQTPDNIAVIAQSLGADIQLSYRQLNERSERLALWLREKGVEPDTIVGIMVGRSVEMMTGIIGILKSGGAYLPIDPEYPQERIDFMLKDSAAKIRLTENEIASFSTECVFNSHHSSLILHHSNHLAYVIYTSGSTGKPKGVMIEHRSVINFIKGITDIISFTPGDCILSLTTLSFDIFGLETILPLTKGAKVIIGGQEEQLETGKIALAIEKENISIFQVIPTRLKLILSDKESSGALKRLKYLLVGGEEFPPALLEGVGSATEGKIYNVYGPTETTIWSTIRDLTGEKTVDIGKPLANTRVYILNKNDRVQPIGVPGELCIGGAGLARGYVNRPEITAEKFMDFHHSSFII